MARIDGRTYKDLRPVEIIPGVNKFAEGSCLIRCGNTHVLCTASVEERVPPHVPYGEGWVTAEYSMLPRANRERSRRDVSKGKLSPRSAEIQRLVGRALRASIDMKALGERTITIDCDVLQGDGGTRTASVTGGYVALALACQWLVKEGYLLRSPLRTAVAAVSAGIVDDELLLDLCYEEDSNAQVDLNCIMTEQGELVEIQGTGEGRAFTIQEQRQLVDLCAKGIDELLATQREALALAQFTQSVMGDGLNILIDTHGWYQQIIPSGDRSGTLFQTFSDYFPGNSYASLRSADGYYSAWAAYTLGYDACLFEFPHVSSAQDFQEKGYGQDYVDAICAILETYGSDAL